MIKPSSTSQIDQAKSFRATANAAVSEKPAASEEQAEDETATTAAESGDGTAPRVPTRKAGGLDLSLMAAWSTEQLEAAMRKGTRPDPDQLIGWEFRGYNPPLVAKVLGIRKFMKGFYHGNDGRFMGYNVMIRQNGGPLESWYPVRLFGRPIRHGYYEVSPVDSYSRDHLFPNALLLDYGRGGNFFLNPSKSIRDYLVQVDPNNPDLLLGKAVLALGPLRRQAWHFILERAHEAVG